jgi:hypothetical protein
MRPTCAQVSLLISIIRQSRSVHSPQPLGKGVCSEPAAPWVLSTVGPVYLGRQRGQIAKFFCICLSFSASISSFNAHQAAEFGSKVESAFSRCALVLMGSGVGFECGFDRRAAGGLLGSWPRPSHAIGPSADTRQSSTSRVAAATTRAQTNFDIHAFLAKSAIIASHVAGYSKPRSQAFPSSANRWHP